MKDSLRAQFVDLARNAQSAARSLAVLDTAIKNKILNDMAESLSLQKDFILQANNNDVEAASKQGLSKALIERLTLNEKRIQGMSDSMKELVKLADPVGAVLSTWNRPNGLAIKKIRVPIGTVLIIYESRPNVTADCIGLCFKSGNAVILRGGSESLNSNIAIYQVLTRAMEKYAVPKEIVNLVTTADRKAIDVLLKLNEYIDLVIPRGGEGLIKRVARGSRIPVIKHYKGICHVYVDELADLNMAENICFNAKVQRPGVCNAMESMLVHTDVAARFLPSMLKKFKDAGVEVRGCPVTQKIVRGIKRATDKDYRTEYLDLILSVKVINSLKSAIEHINNYGSHHSDSIVTDNKENADIFLKGVDSACVYVNASTRFTDGYEFGMGAEIGISTDKLHARGPMALEELTSYKYQIYGNGQIRE